MCIDSVCHLIYKLYTITCSYKLNSLHSFNATCIRHRASGQYCFIIQTCYIILSVFRKHLLAQSAIAGIRYNMYHIFRKTIARVFVTFINQESIHYQNYDTLKSSTNTFYKCFNNLVTGQTTLALFLKKTFQLSHLPLALQHCKFTCFP